MKIKLFTRHAQRVQLRDLYRAAQEGGKPPAGVDAELHRAFAADQLLMQQLGRLAARSAPVNPPIGRATLLSEVARKKSHALEKEREPMIRRVLTGRALALLATAGIFAGGAVTVGASGGVSDAAGNVNGVLAALHITDRTPDQADAHLDDIKQPDGSGKPSDVPPPDHGGGLSNAGEHADDHADHGLQTAAAGGDNASEGIQNASPTSLDHANSHALDGTPAEKGASDTHGPATLPAQANEHASEGAGNGEASPTPHTDSDSSEGSNHASGH